MFKKTVKDGIGADIKKLKKISLPNCGKSKIILINRNFSGYEALLNIHINEKILSVIILSYWISVKTSEKVHQICDDVKIIAANNLKMATRSKFDYYKDKNLKLTDIHAKFQLIKTNSNYYVISSSANFGTIDNLDFVIIQNNKNLYKKLCRVVKAI